jgi:hypothetical protein
MKIQKLNIILSGVLVFLLMTSCENQPIEFEDFKTTACYFPYQSPARTLILGKYDEGFNDNDNKGQFEIGVTMTGVYENKEDRKVYFELDTALLSNIANIKYLPTTHYTIETVSPVIIPKGDIKGRIMIKLTNAFFNDPKSVSTFFSVGVPPVCNYAIPLKITKVEGLDSILSGKPSVTNPIRTIATNWSVLPKDYTLFAIKYINKFHGNYLRRGADKVLNSLTNAVIGTTIYRNKFVEGSEVVKASTFDLNSILVPSIIRRYNAASGGNLSFKFEFAADGSCKVINTANSTEIGTGILKENGDMWGGKTRDVIYLDYSYIDATKNEKHEVKDTMVIRDRAIGFETYVPTLKP